MRIVHFNDFSLVTITYQHVYQSADIFHIMDIANLTLYRYEELLLEVFGLDVLFSLIALFLCIDRISSIMFTFLYIHVCTYLYECIFIKCIFFHINFINKNQLLIFL